MRQLAARRAVLLCVTVALAGCGPALKPPQWRVDKIAVEKARLSALGLDVFFFVRNPNPDPVLIDGLEYELVLNGHRIGRGYYPDVVALGPFGQERILSHLDVNWFALPGAVRSVIERERARANCFGTFYVRQGPHRGKALHFDSQAVIELR